VCDSRTDSQILACAFEVDFIEHFLIGFGYLFEDVKKLVLFDLIIVVDKDASLCSRLVVVVF